MKRTISFVMVLVLLVGTMVAQAYAEGYRVTTTAPEPNMLPLNYTFNKTVYDASGGGLVPKTVSMTITGYVVWISPPRPAEYLCTITDTTMWFMFNRETIDAG